MTIIKFTHEKLGELIFEKDPNGRPIYTRAKIEEIFYKGIDCLYAKNLLSKNEKMKILGMLDTCEIDIKDNLGDKVKYQYQYNAMTGEAYPTSIFIDENNKYLNIDSTVNAIIDMLCQIIVSILYPNNNIYNEDNGKNELWIKYALALLPQEEVEEYILRSALYKQAFDYITHHITKEQRKLFKKSYENDWIDFLCDGYADMVIDDCCIEEIERGEYITVEDYLSSEEEHLLDFGEQ